MSILYTRMLYWITTVAMYLFVLLFIFVFGVIVVRLFTSGYVIHDVPVQLKTVENLPSVSPNTNTFTFQSIPGAEAVLKLNIRLTPANIVFVFVGFLLYAYLTFTIIVQLRKLFSSLLKNNPFDIVNVRRLYTISWCLVGIVVVNLSNRFYHRYILTHYFDQSEYVAKLEPGWSPLLLAMTVLVLSAVFRKGYELKSDNESIV